MKIRHQVQNPVPSLSISLKGFCRNSSRPLRKNTIHREN